MLELLSYLYHDERGEKHSFYLCHACQAVVLRRDSHARNQQTCKCTPNNLIHGHARTFVRSAEWTAYGNMLSRCHNSRCPGYRNYGGRGIAVCSRWRTSFEAFLSDIGPKPSPTHSLERIDVNAAYEPGNCRWATKAEQVRNKRNNRNIEINGVTRTFAEWRRELGVCHSTFYRRLRRGLTNEQALGLL